MRDEDFEAFIEEFGEADSRQPVPESDIAAWTGKLPDQLMAYWREEGWGRYGEGRFWFVNPADYEDIVDEWLENSPLEQIDSFHVIARTAFGKLYLCGQRSGQSATINCATNAVFAVPKRLKPKTPDARDMSILVFLGVDREECDLDDEDGKPMFARAMKALGPLAEDEVYGFEPALVAGGRMRVENLRKLKIDQHLTILRQLAAPSMPFSGEEVARLLKD
ncbi:GAD-like domain-containing protein [Mitsuaria sp. CC2]|uniref:GAD-like domain-containing protein n=1 Tax=Mitsuaria sp. CC2 TaxID=3029186 RepID=UPI003B8AF886